MPHQLDPMESNGRRHIPRWLPKRPLLEHDIGVADTFKDPFRSQDSALVDTSSETLESRDGSNMSSETGAPPRLYHKVKIDSSILTLAVGDERIYAGTQDGEILVWNLSTFELDDKVQAHKRAVLCLFLSQDQKLLFSSGGDAIVNVWCISTGKLVRLHEIYSTYDIGDVFSVAYSSQFETVYLGAQNTSIQWCSLKEADRSPPSLSNHPDVRNHKFFDSVAAGGKATPRAPSSGRSTLIPRPSDNLEIDMKHMRHFAHFGYVYCMLLARGTSRHVDSCEDTLISGGGDGTIKIWKLRQDQDEGIEELACLGEDDAQSVLSLALDGTFLYSGKLGGIIELWDLDTQQKFRVMKAHSGDVMTVQIGCGLLWSADASGVAQKHKTTRYGHYQNSDTENYQLVSRWKAHDGRVLASALSDRGGQPMLITGANDNTISIWDVEDCQLLEDHSAAKEENLLLRSLKTFVGFKTVSSNPDLAEDCRRGASWLRALFESHGAQTEMLTAGKNNPVVFAKFKGNPTTAASRKKILFYGHYDVVPADNKAGKWIIDPFKMEGINGYLYGRGVSDNKGPIMAALYGVVDLILNQSLGSDIIFLIEGEEESGSRGFKEAIRRHKELIGDIDYILLANSYWLDDEVPCLTYGLRGVIHATLKVISEHKDVHSGVDGSHMLDEPLTDLTAIISKLKGKHNRVQIPGFYDTVLPLTPAEDARYKDITETLIRRNPDNGPPETLKASLLARWREPNLTIHRFNVSGPVGSLVSSRASAVISLRIVPNQEVDDVVKALRAFLSEAFGTLDTHNSMSITIDHSADAWLGDPDNEIFQTLEEAIREVWGPIGEGRRSSLPSSKHLAQPLRRLANGANSSLKPIPATASTLTNGSDHTSLAVLPNQPSSKMGRKPLYIREGGSIPSIRFLEKEFNAPAAHLPCGQASDSAHLDNERLRLLNLHKSREIFKKVFRDLPKK